MTARSTELSVRNCLPRLPVQMHPVVGSGLIESSLMCHYETPDKGMTEWFNNHRAEKAHHRACFWMKPLRGDSSRAAVFFIPGFEKKCRHWPAGITKNDPAAAIIQLANSRAGWNLPGIRWELYSDPNMEELVDMGMFHQWGILGSISKKKLQALAQEGVEPCGDWDFHRLIWTRVCSVCGSHVSVNDHLFDIDSVVCANCRNRPFMAPWIHRTMDTMLELGGEYLAEFSQRTLGWMTRVRASFDQVRRDKADTGGARIQSEIWQQSLIRKAADPETSQQVRHVIVRSGADFEMFCAGCRILGEALRGQAPFREEHVIAMRYVMDSAQLIQTRLISTAGS